MVNAFILRFSMRLSSLWNFSLLSVVYNLSRIIFVTNILNFRSSAICVRVWHSLSFIRLKKKKLQRIFWAWCIIRKTHNTFPLTFAKRGRFINSTHFQRSIVRYKLPNCTNIASLNCTDRLADTKGWISNSAYWVELMRLE